MDPSNPTTALLSRGTPVLRIALAEDDRDLRELIADALRERGFEVLEASDGSSLLSLLRRGAFDVVVTDLWMPSLTGIDVVHTRRREGDATPFLVITAAPASITDPFAALDRVTILHKPFTADVLIAAVERVLAVAPA